MLFLYRLMISRQLDLTFCRMAHCYCFKRVSYSTP